MSLSQRVHADEDRAFLGDVGEIPPCEVSISPRNDCDADGLSYEDMPVERMPPPLSARWEDDMDVDACRKCQRKFTLFFRKHHCRRCGRIFCDACTSQRAQLPEDVHVTDPSSPDMLELESGYFVRVCDWCVDEYDIVTESGSTPSSDVKRPFLSRIIRLSPFTSTANSPTSSSNESGLNASTSVLAECPVCDLDLMSLSSTEERERHVADCLEHGPRSNWARRTNFLVSSLTNDSALIGKECIICMDDFTSNDRIARLACLCYFHADCIRQWMEKGHACPVHANVSDDA